MAEKAGIIADRISEFSCIHCGNVMDVSEISSFTKIKCPECGQAQRVPAQLGSFLLLEPLGAGGMGMIYRAIDQTLGRYVALKVMKKSLGDNPEFVTSFKHEAQAAAALNHKNVVQIYSFGQEKGQPYIVMELVDGGRLDKMIEGGQQLPEAKALSIHIEVTEGLHAASDVGLVHGDIKPANILFGKNGEAKVVDFGLASFIGQKETQSGEIWGTPYYIAPEKAKGKPADFRSDIYSLGGTLFHVLTGCPPFDGDTPLDVVLARLNNPAPNILEYRPDLTEETAAMIARTLEVEPSMRHPSYLALLADMRAALEAANKGGRPGKNMKVRKKVRKTPVTNRDSGKSRKILIGASAGLAAILLLGGLVFGGIQWKKQADAEKARIEQAKRISDAYETVDSVIISLVALNNMIKTEVSTNIVPLIEKIERINAPETDDIMLDIHKELDRSLIAAADARLILMKGAEIKNSSQNIEDVDTAETLATEIEELRTELVKRYNITIATKDILTKLLPEAEALQREANVRIARERQAARLKQQEEARRRQEEERKKREAIAAAKELEALAETEQNQVTAKRAEIKPLLEAYRFADAVNAITPLNKDFKTDPGKTAARNLLDVYRSLSEMKNLIIKNLPTSPYNIQLSAAGQPREIRKANEKELMMTAPQGGTITLEWKSLTVPQFLRMANTYAENTRISTSDRAKIMMGIALFCHEMSSINLAQQFAAKASRLNPNLQSEIDRMMPELHSQ